MANQPRHRRHGRGSFFLLLRLVTALAVALISLPALNLSAQADELAPDTTPEVVATEGAEPALEEAVAPPPVEEVPPPPVEEPVVEEAAPPAEEPAPPVEEQAGPASSESSKDSRSADTARTSSTTSLLALVDPALEAALGTADYTVEDERGANDEPGQKDLTQFFGFTADSGSVKIGWSWDETDWSGNNTGDACALFDTDGDGKANYAVCVTITDSPAVQLDTDANPSPRLYSCGDAKVDRCTSPVVLVASGAESDIDCQVAQTGTDPFATGDEYPIDTSALCTIPLDEMNGGTPRLINVCSYPSQEPNSDPSDCVLIPRDATLTVVKVVTPPAAQDQTEFGFTIDGMSELVTFSLQQGESETIPVRSGVDLDLSENDLDGWRLMSATCSNQQDPSALKLASEATVTCTFTNTRTASVLVNKTWIINGVTYNQGATIPADHSATLELTDQTDPSFGTTYPGYTIGDSVTIGEDVDVPSGCTNSATGDTGTKTLGGGLNTYTITNTVTCAASVQVNKTWIINGTTYTQGATIPNGYTADLTLTGQQSPTFGTPYPDYTAGATVTVDETNVRVPDGCTNQKSGNGDKTLAKGLNTYTITNTVTCGASVQVDKTWIINGTTYTQGATIPAGYTATLVLTDQSSPSFGTPYGGYTQGETVNVDETFTVPDGCTNQKSGNGDKTLAKGLNTYTITNTVTCGASVQVNKTWIINGTTYTQGATIPAGYSATLTLTGQPSASFGTTYGTYREGQIVNVDETSVVVPPGCTNQKSGNGDKTLTRGLNTYTITNTVTCPPPPPPPVIDPAWSLTKSSSPASGTTVEPGQQVTYTLTAANTSFAVVDEAVVTDNLSDVLDNATLTQPLPTGLTISGTTLTWDVPTLATVGSLGSSATVSYTVTVDPDEWGETLRNVATPSGDGGLCPTTGGCQTLHPTPAWELTKVSDPESGSEVDPGSDITYTLTAVNTSAAVVTGALAEDDLSEVLNNASLDAGSLDEALSLDGTTLTWELPTLLPGEEATVSYTVTVDLETSSVILENVVAPISGGGICVEADDCTTTHNTPEILGEEVIVPKPEPQPRPPVTVLPATGAPEGAGAIGLLGIGGLLLGGLLMIGDSRRRRAREQF